MLDQLASGERWAHQSDAYSAVPVLHQHEAKSVRNLRPFATTAISPSAESVAKRTIDIVVSAALLIFLAPLLLLVAAIIASDGRGQVLFTQRRTGLRGKEFKICKFRTMSVCEDGGTIVQARRGDARITPFGRLLRCTSIDELPQLLNVLVGQMSLIGPRPHVRCHDEIFAKRMPDYVLRFQARPGISGLAQVRGFRGEINCDKALIDRVSSDLEYIVNWSLRSDFEIFLKSCLLVFRPHGY